MHMVHGIAAIFGYTESAEKWVLKGKLHFEKSSDMTKNLAKMKKSLVQLAFKTHFSMALRFLHAIIGFQVQFSPPPIPLPIRINLDF